MFLFFALVKLTIRVPYQQPESFLLHQMCRLSACLRKRSIAASKPPFITLRSVDKKSVPCKSAVPILTASISVRHSRIGAYFATRRKVLITHLT